MTREELIERCGSNDQVDLVIDIILSSIKPQFVKGLLSKELKKVDGKLEEYIQQGFVVKHGVRYRVNWKKATITWKDMENEEKYNEYDRLRRECGKADALIYKRNRLLLSYLKL